MSPRNATPHDLPGSRKKGSGSWRACRNRHRHDQRRPGGGAPKNGARPELTIGRDTQVQREPSQPVAHRSPRHQETAPRVCGLVAHTQGAVHRVAGSPSADSPGSAEGRAARQQRRTRGCHEARRAPPQFNGSASPRPTRCPHHPGGCHEACHAIIWLSAPVTFALIGCVPNESTCCSKACAIETKILLLVVGV